MKKISVLIVMLVFVFSCAKPVIVEKKFDVLKNVSLSITNNSTVVQLEIGDSDFAVTTVTTEIPQFVVGDSLTGRFLNNQLQAVKDNKGSWLNVSKLK